MPVFFEVALYLPVELVDDLPTDVQGKCVIIFANTLRSWFHQGLDHLVIPRDVSLAILVAVVLNADL